MTRPTEITDSRILTRIHIIRGLKVMLDADLAELYSVPTRVLKQAVRRNLDRFPEDFMFELTKSEFDNLRSQFVISRHGGTRYMPMAFTEHGVLMLSSVLRSAEAIQMNIRIMRVFLKMRELLQSHQHLLEKLEQIEKTSRDHDKLIKVLYQHLRQLIQKEEQPAERKRIGFKQ